MFKNRSYLFLIVLNLLSLFFISGWPARQLYSGVEGDAGLGYLFILPLAWIAGIFLVLLIYLISRIVLKLQGVSIPKVLITTFLLNSLGIVLFFAPIYGYQLLHDYRLSRFDVVPVILTESLDKSSRTYQFTYQIDNRTKETFKDVEIHAGTGFDHGSGYSYFVSIANQALPRTLDLPPGKTELTESIYLGDCSENIMFRREPARLQLSIVYEPLDNKGNKQHLDKEFIFTPAVAGEDFTDYYIGNCNWFSYD